MNSTFFENANIENCTYLTSNIFLVVFLYYVLFVGEGEEIEIPVLPVSNPILLKTPLVKYPLKSFPDRNEDYLLMKDRLKHSYVIEYFDRYGNIIMMYDFSGQSFHYYADKSNTPFHDLETCARKFVNTFQCPELYVIHSSSPSPLVVVEKEIKKKSLFANLKKNLKKPVLSEISEIQCNSFVYRGKITNFHILQRILPQRLSYADFKQKHF